VVGRADLVRTCARHPLARALRAGGLVLAALQDVALAYLDRRAGDLPFWRMASAPLDDLRDRAERAAAASGGAGWAVVDTAAVTGGGTLPGVEIPSIGVASVGDHVAALREHEPPVIARVSDGRTVCDLRTVDPDDDPVLATALTSLPAST
jgi:L-seryl-tRNA(Ser) seleniumtransferase